MTLRFSVLFCSDEMDQKDPAQLHHLKLHVREIGVDGWDGTPEVRKNALCATLFCTEKPNVCQGGSGQA
eukprot:COSAG06_NODE_858_length_11909_cov_6.018036_9_plen_69_part_00